MYLEVTVQRKVSRLELRIPSKDRVCQQSQNPSALAPRIFCHLTAHSCQLLPTMIQAQDKKDTMMTINPPPVIYSSSPPAINLNPPPVLDPNHAKKAKSVDGK
jgi:hypothetical protein